MQEGRESSHRRSIQKERMEFHEKPSAFFGIGVFVHVGVEKAKLSRETGKLVTASL